jgi:hypothetical protein
VTKSCIACGMPLEKPEDHALGDPSKTHCRHCARPDGSLRSYEEAVEGMAGWMMRTQGLDAGVARKLAIETMATLPAWRDRATAS